MAAGDAAAEAGMSTFTGTEDARTIAVMINEALDYIAQFAAGIRAIAAGGTGASDAAGARANLDVYSKEEIAALTPDQLPNIPASKITSGTLGVGVNAPGANGVFAAVGVGKADGTGGLTIGGTGNGFNGFGDLSARNGNVGGTLNAGALSTPNLTGTGAVNFTGLGGSSSGTALQIVGSTVYKYTSSARFKTDIKQLANDELPPVLAAQIVSYRDKAEFDGTDYPMDITHVGVIAEQLVEAGLSQFVSFDEAGQAEAVNYGQLAVTLIPIVAQLRADVDALKQQLAGGAA